MLVRKPPMTASLTNGDRNGSGGTLILLDQAAPGGDRVPGGARGLSTARAVLRVLSFMATHPQGVTARGVATELGKSISTAYDLLASLHAEGFAVHEPSHGYRLSPEIAIGCGASKATSTQPLSRAVHELFARTRRRSYLGRVQSGAIVITAVCGRQGIRKMPGLGPRIGANAHALAMGKVVLSLLPESGRRRYAERGLTAYTPRTIASPDGLMFELERVRRNGYAIDRGEFDLEFSCIAAPILSGEGRLLAVLGLSTSSRTFDAEREDLLAAVRDVAAAVGRPGAASAPAMPVL